MFEAVIKATRTDAGHSAIADVTVAKKPRLSDNMESFWLPLKHSSTSTCSSKRQMLFPLDEWVLNTEAHPFRRPT